MTCLLFSTMLFTTFALTGDQLTPAGQLPSAALTHLHGPDDFRPRSTCLH